MRFEVEIPDKDNEKLKRDAKRNARSKKAHAEWILRKYLRELPRFRLEKEDEED